MKVSKLFAGVIASALVGALLITPVMAGTLEQDKAWVEAQAAAGLKAAQAALDAAFAAIAPAQATTKAQAEAGLKAAQAAIDAAAVIAPAKATTEAQAAEGLKKAQAYLDAAAQTLKVAADSRDKEAAAGLERAKDNLRRAGWNI